MSVYDVSTLEDQYQPIGVGGTRSLPKAPQCLQHLIRTDCKIQNGPQVTQKWPMGSRKEVNDRGEKNGGKYNPRYSGH